MPSLIIQAEGTEEKYALEAGIVTLGRGLESDIRLKDIKASRRHCQVVKTPEGFKVVDLDSGNGTFLNGIQIKEQKLKNGDRIQIGQTVIIYEGAMESAPKKSPTAAMPKVGPAAKKSATARVPTVQVRPVAKPATAAHPAVKPATGAHPAKAATSRVPTQAQPAKPPTQRATKTGTGSVPKTGATAAMSRKTTGRMTTRKDSASARFKAEAGRKKGNPLAVLGILLGVALIAVVVLVFSGVFSGGPTRDFIIATVIKPGMAKANEAYAGNDWDTAEAEYNKILAELKRLGVEEKFKNDIQVIQTGIKDVADGRNRDRELDALWMKWKEGFDGIAKEAEGGAKVDREQLIKDYRLILESVGGDGPHFAWFAQLKTLKEKLDQIMDAEKSEKTKYEYANFRKYVNDTYGTARDEESGRWGPAVKEWQQYITKVPGEAGRAEGEIKRIESYAKGWLARFRTRAARMKTEGEDVKAFLNSKLPQYEGSASLDEFKKLVGEYN